MTKITTKKDSIIDKVDIFIKNNPEYVLLETVTLKREDPSFLLAKRKELTVTTTFDANYFQPHEHVETKNYVLCFILSFAKKNLPSSFKKYIQLGCDVIDSNSGESVQDLEKRCSAV